MYDNSRRRSRLRWKRKEGIISTIGEPGDIPAHDRQKVDVTYNDARDEDI